MLQKIVILILFKLMLGSCAFAANSIIEVIPLYNRPASEITPLLDPLLENGDHVIADGSNLLIRTSPHRLTQIKAFINKLDTRLNDLIITVIQSQQATAEELNAQTRAQINPSEGSIEGHYYQTQDRNAHDNRQTIRTLEGKPAFIKIGNTVPVQTYQSYGAGYGYAGVSSSTEFVEASTGFAVTPRLTGQQVILDIAPWSENFKSHNRIQAQQLQTTLTTNLGEWVSIGGIDESMQGSSNQPIARRWQTHGNQMRVLIKVEKVNE
jgi:type II secretory pathway component GspD/PulD (secretin)